jgi:flavodoxin
MKTPSKTAMLVLKSLGAFASIACSTASPDVVSRATSAIYDQTGGAEATKAKVLIVATISKTGGTAKIAKAIAEVLGARVTSPLQVKAEELQDYSLIGFGSGIFDQKHHASLFGFADSLPELPGKKAFIFSTSGVARQFAVDNGIDDPHTPLRERLQSKGLEIVGDYNCAGFNDNSFLKLLGGMNKGKPDARDIQRAKAFAEELKRRFLDPPARR